MQFSMMRWYHTSEYNIKIHAELLSSQNTVPVQLDDAQEHVMMSFLLSAGGYINLESVIST